MDNKNTAKRVQRQAATRPSYYEGETSDGDMIYDILMDDKVISQIKEEEPIKLIKAEKEEVEGSTVTVKSRSLEQENTKTRREILFRLHEILMEEKKNKRKIFVEQLKQLDEEARAVREGTHPEYEERLQQIMDRRDQLLEKYRVQRNYELQCIQQEYDAEMVRLEEVYQAQVQAIYDKMIADFEEKKRKIFEDFESFDIHNDTAMDGTMRAQTQRRLLRTRTAQEAVEVKVKKQKVSADILSYY